MAEKSPEPRLHDMLRAIDRIQAKLAGMSMETFQDDLDRRQIVERNFEILSEASRHLPEDIKQRHGEIPWKKVAGIGNILRHDYENVVPDFLWAYAQADLLILEKVCRSELAREQQFRATDLDDRDR